MQLLAQERPEHRLPRAALRGAGLGGRGQVAGEIPQPALLDHGEERRQPRRALLTQEGTGQRGVLVAEPGVHGTGEEVRPVGRARPGTGGRRLEHRVLQRREHPFRGVEQPEGRRAALVGAPVLGQLLDTAHARGERRVRVVRRGPLVGQLGSHVHEFELPGVEQPPVPAEDLAARREQSPIGADEGVAVEVVGEGAFERGEFAQRRGGRGTAREARGEPVGRELLAARVLERDAQDERAVADVQLGEPTVQDIALPGLAVTALAPQVRDRAAHLLAHPRGEAAQARVRVRVVPQLVREHPAQLRLGEALEERQPEVQRARPGYEAEQPRALADGRVDVGGEQDARRGAGPRLLGQRAHEFPQARLRLGRQLDAVRPLTGRCAHQREAAHERYGEDDGQDQEPDDADPVVPRGREGPVPETEQREQDEADERETGEQYESAQRARECAHRAWSPHGTRKWNRPGRGRCAPGVNRGHRTRTARWGGVFPAPCARGKKNS